MLQISQHVATLILDIMPKRYGVRYVSKKSIKYGKSDRISDFYYICTITLGHLADFLPHVLVKEARYPA